MIATAVVAVLSGTAGPATGEPVTTSPGTTTVAPAVPTPPAGTSSARPTPSGRPTTTTPGSTTKPVPPQQNSTTPGNGTSAVPPSAPPTSAPPATTGARSTECAGQSAVGPDAWEPTRNPHGTVVPGKMRSDCQKIPDGFTKEQADKAETMEAALAARSSGGVRYAAPGCQVYWPAPYEVCGAIRDKYNELGGPRSFLLFPTSNELTNPDRIGRRSTFQNGPIYWSPAGGAHPVVNHFFAAWQRQGWEGGMLGYPTTDEIPAANGGRRQEFQGAGIYWHFNSAFAIGGAIRDKWATVGAEGGPLGYPTSDEIAVKKDSGRYNNFENGTITWSGRTGTRLVYGAVRDRWAEAGREDGELGYPTGDEQVAPDGIGHYVYFENGTAIYWLPVIGAWRVAAPILNIWGFLEYERGKLGYPIGNPRTTDLDPGIVVAQDFQNGSVGFDGKSAAFVGSYNP
ncbi:hypothetical protein ACWIGW_16420 [Nocardia brasiliensis]